MEGHSLDVGEEPLLGATTVGPGGDIPLLPIGLFLKCAPVM